VSDLILASERENWIALVNTDYLEKIYAVYGSGERNIIDMDEERIPGVPPKHFNLVFTVGAFQLPGVFTDLANEAFKLRGFQQLSGVAYITKDAWVFTVDSEEGKLDRTGILDFCREAGGCVDFFGYFIRPQALTGATIETASDNFVEMFLYFGETPLAFAFENVLEAFAVYSKLLEILSAQGFEIKDV
jgi:hypothetical protein